MVELAHRRLDPVGEGVHSRWQEQVNEFCVDEIALALHATRRTAGVMLSFATDLDELPATRSALWEGRIDQGRARVLVNGLAGQPATTARAVEAAVLPEAGELTSGQLRVAVSKALAHVRAAALDRRRTKAQAERRLQLWPDPASGTGTIHAAGLEGADALAVWSACDAWARARGADDPRGMDARRADALVALVCGHPALGAPASDVPAGSRDATSGAGGAFRRQVRLELAITLDALTGKSLTPAWLSSHGWITPAHARALIRDAETTTAVAVTDPTTGALLTLGPDQTSPLPLTDLPHDPEPGDDGKDPDPDDDRPPDDDRGGPGGGPPDRGGGGGGGSTGGGDSPSGGGGADADDGPGGEWFEDPGPYVIPAAMARLVRARDRVCRFPGCRVPASRCDIDHTRAWPGGPTHPRNLACLCRTHHRLKQSRRWRVARHGPEGLTWTTPTGHTRTRAPTRR